MKFIVHYEDGKIEGAELGSKDSGWSSLPEKPITALEYKLPYNNSLIISGYEEYLHMIEACMQIGRNPAVEYIYIMGRKGNKVTSYRITVLQKTPAARYKMGDITVRTSNKGEEYRGKPTSGWK